MLRPSLSRRLVLAVVAAFGLVAAVLLASAYLQYRQAVASHKVLVQSADHLVDVLDAAPDAASARQIVMAAERYFNAARADLERERGRVLSPLVFELVGIDGQRLHVSAGWQGPGWPVAAGEVALQALNGQAYWVVARSSRYGLLRLGEPQLDDGIVLGWIVSDLLPDLLLAFPFVLIPVWLAVRQGLRPLRALAGQLQRRSRDDFSPLDARLPHAELQPLLTAFDDLLARLREAMLRERAFVQDAAHEMRTPMAVISAQAHVLAKAESSADRVRASAAMDQAIGRASHLTQQLLALAALDDHRAPRAQPVDLALCTQQALVQVAAAAQARRIDLSLDAPQHLPATLDREAFLSIVHNLLDNALRYIDDGGRIDVTLLATSTGWCLRVADDGPGIAPALHATVFDRFVRGADTGVPGTGLGLAIVRQAARRLGGDVRLAEGLNGRGVAFVVTGLAAVVAAVVTDVPAA